MHLPATPPPAIEYPDSDGKPLADNTLQAEWIVVLFGNLRALCRDRGDVFVAADLLWYPVEGEDKKCQAHDVLVAFGRPKGYRGSYKQWQEDDVPVTVAFEVLSPNNSYREMIDKYAFYEEHGVEEYDVFDPETNRLEAYLRKGTALRGEYHVQGLVSPRLGIRFEPSARPVMNVFYPNGDPFLSFEDLAKQYEDLSKRFQDLADRFEALKQRADDEKQRGGRLAELSRKLLQQQLTADEAAELRQLAGLPDTSA